MPAQIFEKPADTRKKPVRMGHVYDSIEAEFESLKRLYHLMPEHVVEPFGIYEAGHSFAYSMEAVNGPRLHDYMHRDIDNSFNADYIIQQLDEAKEVIENASEPHGDLRSWNIMLTPESEIKIIDPVGYPEDFSEIYGEDAQEYLDRAVKEDLHNIRSMQRKLQKQTI